MMIQIYSLVFVQITYRCVNMGINMQRIYSTYKQIINSIGKVLANIPQIYIE